MDKKKKPKSASKAKTKSKTGGLSALRKKAQKQLSEQSTRLDSLSRKDIKHLINELGTHQIELEMQNEELRRAGAEIETSQAKYADLYDFSPVGYFTLDRNGLIQELNLTGANMLGMEKRFLRAKPFQNFIEPANRAIFHDHLSKVFTTQTNTTCEITIRKRDGSVSHVQLHSLSFHMGEGDPGVCRTALSDVTERKRAEEALARSEYKYRLLFTNMAEGFALYELLYDDQSKPVDWRVLEVNDAHALHTGISRERIVGRRMSDVFPTAIPEYLPRFAGVVANQKAVEFETYAASVDRYQYVVCFPAGPDRFANTITDITKRKQAEEALRQSEKHHRLLFENMLDGYAYCKMLYDDHDRPIDFVYLHVNNAFERLTGLKNVAGKKVTEVIPGIQESYQELFETYSRVAMTGQPEKFEIEFKPLAIWLSISVYSTERGYFGAVFDDITGYKRAENVMQAKSRMLEASTAAMSVDEALQMTLDEIEAQTNSAIGFYHFLNADQETLSLQTWSTNTLRKMCTAEGKGNHYNISQAGVWVDCVRERRPVIHNEYASLPHRRGLPPGHAPVSREMVVPILRGGRITAIIGVGNKLTDYNEVDIQIATLLGELSWEIVERIRVEKTLRKSEVWFKAIFENSVDAVGVSMNSRHVLVNPSYLSLFGYGSNDELEGKSIFDCIAPGERGKIQEFIRARAQGGFPPREYETRGLKNDGTEFIIDVKVTTFTLSPDIYSLVIIRDITERRKAEDQLKQTSVELAVVNRDLEAFSYAVSHDLRAPLRSIEGFTTAILEDHAASFDETAKDYFQRVTSASSRMSQLIDAMLNMARLTRTELRENTVDLSALAEVAAHELSKTEPDRKVKFIVAKGIKVRGDISLLCAVLENLLGNSWKFSAKQPSATIEFGSTQMDGRDVYFVRDDGTGFPMEFADKLFTPFRRLHTESEFSGIGIGLATVQRIIHRHGGKIWAEGEVGKGATFYFTL